MKLTGGISKSHLKNAHKSQKSPERVDAHIALVPLLSVPCSGVGQSTKGGDLEERALTVNVNTLILNMQAADEVRQVEVFIKKSVIFGCL